MLRVFECWGVWDMAISTYLLSRHANYGGNIENQCHHAVSHDGRPRQSGNLAIIGLEAFDDDLVLAKKGIDLQGGAYAVGIEHDENALSAVSPFSQSEEVLEPDHRQ